MDGDREALTVAAAGGERGGRGRKGWEADILSKGRLFQHQEMPSFFFVLQIREISLGEESTSFAELAFLVEKKRVKLDVRSERRQASSYLSSAGHQWSERKETAG
jgi:hypothetical protein